jgi:hypothetical protein
VSAAVVLIGSAEHCNTWLAAPVALLRRCLLLSRPLLSSHRDLTRTCTCSYAETPTDELVREVAFGGRKLTISAGFPRVLATVINSCFDTNPGARPDFGAVEATLRAARVRLSLAPIILSRPPLGFHISCRQNRANTRGVGRCRLSSFESTRSGPVRGVYRTMVTMLRPQVIQPGSNGAANLPTFSTAQLIAPLGNSHPAAERALLVDTLAATTTARCGSLL